MIRASGMDLGTEGAIYRAKLDNGIITPLSCEGWNWSAVPEELRYHEFASVCECELEWADAVGYEHVQFNRGKSIIEGLRGVLLSEATDAEILCHGINVSTLKSYAIPGKKRKRDKNAMARALAIEWPDFYDKIVTGGKKDDIVDAAWVVIWLLSNIREGEGG